MRGSLGGDALRLEVLSALGATKPSIAALRFKLPVGRPRRALLPPPRFLFEEAAVLLLLPRHVPTPRLAPTRYGQARPLTLDLGLVGLGLTDYSPSHALVERSAPGGRFGTAALTTLRMAAELLPEGCVLTLDLAQGLHPHAPTPTTALQPIPPLTQTPRPKAQAGESQPPNPNHDPPPPRPPPPGLTLTLPRHGSLVDMRRNSGRAPSVAATIEEVLLPGPAAVSESPNKALGHAAARHPGWLGPT